MRGTPPLHIRNGRGGDRNAGAGRENSNVSAGIDGDSGVRGVTNRESGRSLERPGTDASTGSSGEAALLPQPIGSTRRFLPSREISSKMASIVWYPILAALSFLLSHCTNPAEIQHVLIAYQSFTETCATLNVSDAMTSFVESLCKFALPARMQSASIYKPAMPKDLKEVKSMEQLLSEKHIQVLKALLNISHCLGDHLGGLWMTLLRTFHSLDQVLRINEKAIQLLQAKQKPTGKDPYPNKELSGVLPDQNDLESLAQALDQLFERSYLLSNPALSQLMSALGSLCLTALANAATAEAELEDMKKLDSRIIAPTTTLAGKELSQNAPKIFALNKLLVTIEANMRRVVNPISDKNFDKKSPGSSKGTNSPVRFPTLGISGTTTKGNVDSSKGNSGTDAGGQGESGNSEGNDHLNIWEAAMGYLNIMMNHKDRAVRRYGIFSLRRFLLLALDRVNEAEKDKKKRTTQGGGDSRDDAKNTDAETDMANARNTEGDGVRKESEGNTEGAGISGSDVGGGNTEDRKGRKPPRPTIQLEEIDDVEVSLLIPGGGTRGVGNSNDKGFGDLERGVVEKQLLSPLVDFYRSKHLDTRTGTLETLFAVLQSHGHSLHGPGWSMVLAILSHVAKPSEQALTEIKILSPTHHTPVTIKNTMPTERDFKPLSRRLSAAHNATKAEVRLGLESLQLITGDFLESIPLAHVPLLISTIGDYCRQNQDINVSFKSVTLLWTISDHLQPGTNGASANTGSDDKTTVTGSPSSTEATGNTDAEGSDVESLRVRIFQELKELSMDPRSQVRASAIKTFESTLSTHGARIKSSTWIQCLKTIIFPLLSELLDHSKDTERTDNKEKELGKDRGTGKKVLMMVHFSRDTAQKQWDETRVFALRAIGAILGEFFPIMSKSREFHLLWTEFLDHIHYAVRNNSLEVATASINTLATVLQAPGSVKVVKRHRVLWVKVLELFLSLIKEKFLEARSVFGKGGTSGNAAMNTEDAECSERNTEADMEHWIGVATQVVQSLVLVLKALRPILHKKDISTIVWTCHMVLSIRTSIPQSKGGTRSALMKQLHRHKVNNGGLRVNSLKVLEMLAPLPIALWKTVLNTLLRYIQGKDGGGEFEHLQKARSNAHSGKSKDIPSLMRIAEPSRDQLIDDATYDVVSRTTSVAGRGTQGTQGGTVEGYPLSPTGEEPSEREREALTAAEAKLEAEVEDLWKVYEETKGGEPEAEDEPKKEIQKEFYMQALRSFVALYCAKAPATVKSDMLVEVTDILLYLVLDLESLGWKLALTEPNRAGNFELVMEGVVALIKVFAASLPCMQYTSQKHVDEIWTKVVDATRALLLTSDVETLLEIGGNEAKLNKKKSGRNSSAVSTRGTSTAFSAQLRKLWLKAQSKVVEGLVKGILPHSKPASEHIQKALLSLLGDVACNRVSQDSKIKRESSSIELMHECLMGLFTLCHQGGSKETTNSCYMDMAYRAAPLLLSRCEELLTKYIQVENNTAASTGDTGTKGDESNTIDGKPSPELRSEIQFVLKQLRDLHLHPNVSKRIYTPPSIESIYTESKRAGTADANTNASNPEDQYALSSAGNTNDRGLAAASRVPYSLSDVLVPREHPGSPRNSGNLIRLSPQTNHRGHLLKLYPTFCQCIAIRDQGIREVVLEIMQLIGVEFGIMLASAASSSDA